MRLFHCDQCNHIVFFESVQCVHCGSTLAYVPGVDDVSVMVGISGSAPGQENYQRLGDISHNYRMCANRTHYQACNFAIAADDPNPLCTACRQTEILPDLAVDGNTLRWQKLETAKRRLYYTLARMGLHPENADSSPRFQFLADLPNQPMVLTGHASGLITINVAEADDDERARRRLALHEPYRTLLGHLRHESGHFYWDRLVRDGGHLESFRTLFGDERQDYAQALQHYYDHAPSYAEWSPHFVSAYASAHPWEDWAESWAHYLHMVDALETTASYHTSLAVPEGAQASPVRIQDPFASPAPSFDDMVSQWVPVTLLLNSMNRSLGQADAYPFALSSGALRKLRYVHALVHNPTSLATLQF